MPLAIMFVAMFAYMAWDSYLEHLKEIEMIRAAERADALAAAAPKDET